MLRQSLAQMVHTGRLLRRGPQPSALSDSSQSLTVLGIPFGLTVLLQQPVRWGSQLSYEEVTAGAPTPEHPTAPPSRTLFILHGLLGCGRNWRTWARRLVEGAAARYPPAEGGPWRVLLVDLRCHGGSARRPGLHPPHNMRSAAEDVSRLIQHKIGSHAPGAVLGHSMGGKVALALLEACVAAAAAAEEPPGSAAAAAAAAAAAGGRWCAPPRQLWVLDSQPGLVTAEQDSGTGVSRVLNTVHSIPLPVPNRTWLLHHLRQRGLSEALATWLASNLTPLTPPMLAQQPHQHQHQHHSQGSHGEHLDRGTQSAPAGTSQDKEGHHHLRQQQQHHYHHHHHQHDGGGGSTSVGPLTWTFEIQGAAAMYMSYRTTEYWHVLERPPYCTTVYLVQGDRSDRWSSDMERRLRAALDAASASASAADSTSTSTSRARGAGGGAGAGVGAAGGGKFEHLMLEKAGHWLHVDNPEGLLRLVLPRLAGL